MSVVYISSLSPPSSSPSSSPTDDGTSLQIIYLLYATESAEVLLLYPLPPEFITTDTASAGRPNSLDRDCTPIVIPLVGATTTAAVADVDYEVDNDDAPRWL